MRKQGTSEEVSSAEAGKGNMIHSFPFLICTVISIHFIPFLFSPSTDFYLFMCVNGVRASSGFSLLFLSLPKKSSLQ